jgi:ATP-dependent helicase/nuclease subunit B
LSGRQVLAVLLDELGRQSYYPERRPESIDLEGWLELPWNDAPLMIVTGMNEGKVPDSRMGDVFLPDALCERLGLRHDAQRMARDAFLLRTLVESRRAKGRTVLIAGKSSADGEPLKPSRLLFRCRDEHLAARAARLFGPAEEWRDRCPPSLSFRLDVRLPCDVSPERLFPASLSATAFRAYLECPFRFYLRRIVGMEPQSDRKTELDAMEFGNLVHYALQRMGEDPVMLACDDDGLVERHLQGAAEDWVMERFGRHPPIPVVIQLEAARQRLAHAARVQCEQARAGWELVEVEAFRTLLVDGMEIRARADRVERHRETGEIRILDYKTGEKSRKPEETHLGTARGETPDYARVTSGTREKRWADLQLPLYAHLFGQGNDSPRLSVGYFNMPKAVQETGVRVWDGFGGSQLASAMTCARGVISDIKALRFWPPAPKVATPDDDPLEAMFHAEIEKCVDGEAFQAFLESARARAPMPRREGEP